MTKDQMVMLNKDQRAVLDKVLDRHEPLDLIKLSNKMITIDEQSDGGFDPSDSEALLLVAHILRNKALEQETDKEPKCDKHEGVIDYIGSVIKDLNQTKMLVNRCVEICNRDDDFDIDMCIMVLSNKCMTLYTRLIELVNKLDEDYGRYIIEKIK